MVVLYEARSEPGRHPRLPFNLSLSIGSSPFVPIGSPMEVRPILSTHGLVPGGVSLIRPHRSAPAPPGPLPRPTASVRGRNRPHQEPMRTGSQIRARRGRLPPGSLRDPPRRHRDRWPCASRSSSRDLDVQRGVDRAPSTRWNRAIGTARRIRVKSTAMAAVRSDVRAKEEAWEEPDAMEGAVERLQRGWRRGSEADAKERTPTDAEADDGACRGRRTSARATARQAHGTVDQEMRW